ncbi:hypothetical protein SORBI_3006G034200 [Sorghum bicolor]|uniref:Uncharacterized protein n=1 Tax=Sorghum bicolor TaxID=4558 RepID=A0A1Z5RCE8_SORBI|nr:hypothetical protein SORBI_3006G034200 [Sorghum bicolor]
MDPETATTLRKRPLSVRISKPGESGGSMAETLPAPEPLSPTARLFKDLFIVTLFGSSKPIDLAAVRAGLLRLVARHPRFCSIQATDTFNDGTPRWVRTTVNVDDHIVVPSLEDDGDVATNPEQAVEDYVASLSTLAMDFSRPLWEFHILNFPTSATVAATAVFRCHHSLGDGTSMISLVLASAQTADSPAEVEAAASMPPPVRRKGQIYFRPRPPRSAGVLALAKWAWSFVVLAWNTMVDLAGFFATLLFLNDPDTPFKQADHLAEAKSRRVVHRGLSLDDIKYIKNVLNCALADMLDSSNGKDVAWGNRLGFILLPLQIASYNDPLEYIRKAKKTADRKKFSLEVLFTHAVVEITTKLLGAKAAGLVFDRMLGHTTISLSSVMGPVEKIELSGHPIVFIAPTTFGVPEPLVLHFFCSFLELHIRVESLEVGQGLPGGVVLRKALPLDEDAPRAVTKLGAQDLRRGCQ